MKILVVSADRGEPGGWPRNIGDELLTERLASFLRSRGHDVAVADFGSRSPDRDRTMVTTRADLWRGIRSVDLVCVGGGTLIQDDQPARLFAGLPRLCFTVILLSRLLRKPAGFVCVGVQPLDRRITRFACRWSVRRARFVLARDTQSVLVAESMRARRTVLACDAALLGSPLLQPVSIGDGVALALNRAQAAKVSAVLLSSLVQQYGSVRLISMDQSDSSDMLALSAALPAGVEVVAANLGSDDVVACMARSRVVFASRMHALYIAALLGKPSIAVASSSKVSAFAAEFGIPVVPVEDLALPGTKAVAVDRNLLDRVAARGSTALDAALQGVQR